MLIMIHDIFFYINNSAYVFVHFCHVFIYANKKELLVYEKSSFFTA